MDKVNLRKKVIQELKSVPLAQKHAIEKKISTHLFSSSLWKNARVIGITCSQSFEWDTMHIMKEAWKQQKTIAVPKVNDRDKSLTFYLVHAESQLTSGYKGIREPNSLLDLPVIYKNDMDLIVVPGLYFDKAGYRIGFGGGYYDRYLANFKHETVSLLCNQQLVPTIHHEAHDIAVNYLITESGILQTD